ncbi:MAG: MFS transporter [Anaerorhabdus sp.]
MSDKKKIIIMVMFAVCIHTALNFGHPVTPTFLKERVIDERYFGILFSTMALMMTIFSPFWGSRGDVLGRRVLIAIGMAGYGLGQFIFGIGETIGIILVGRAISGCFAAAIFSNQIAAFSEISNQDNRSRNISLIVSVGIFANAIGYFIGGRLGVIFSATSTLMIQGIFAMTVGFMAYVFYPNTTTVQKERTSFIQNLSNLKNMDKYIIYLLFSVLFWNLARNNVAKYFDVYLNNQAFNSAQIGNYIMITGIIGGLFTLLFVPMITRKFKMLTIMVVSLTVTIVLLFMTFMINNIELAMASTYLIYTVLTTVYTSVEQTYISRSIKQSHGTVLGVRESFRAMGLVIGPLLVTAIFSKTDELVFYFNGVIYFVALLFLFVFIYKKIRK